MAPNMATDHATESASLILGALVSFGGIARAAPITHLVSPEITPVK